MAPPPPPPPPPGRRIRSRVHPPPPPPPRGRTILKRLSDALGRPDLRPKQGPASVGASARPSRPQRSQGNHSGWQLVESKLPEMPRPPPYRSTRRALPSPVLHSRPVRPATSTSRPRTIFHRSSSSIERMHTSPYRSRQRSGSRESPRVGAMRMQHRYSRSPSPTYSEVRVHRFARRSRSPFERHYTRGRSPSRRSRSRSPQYVEEPSRRAARRRPSMSVQDRDARNRSASRRRAPSRESSHTHRSHPPYRRRSPFHESDYERTPSTRRDSLSPSRRFHSPGRIHEWMNRTPALPVTPPPLVSPLQSSSTSSLPSLRSPVPSSPEHASTPPPQRQPLPLAAATASQAVHTAHHSPNDDAEGTGTKSIEERELELSRKELEVAHREAEVEEREAEVGEREAEVEEREEAVEQRSQEAEDLMAEATRVAAWAREMMQALAEAQAEARDAGVHVPQALASGEGSDESDVEDDEQGAGDGTPGAGLRGSMATTRSTWYTVRTVKSYKERTNRGPPKKEIVMEESVVEV
ncbi:hypothetical protein BC834DRAFT_375603 [Gloeopeniophorella convolvens]|nr:hypothetical protein BC834DRAFT_375603 [Gloeopeniophorella convolvens]